MSSGEMDSIRFNMLFSSLPLLSGTMLQGEESVIAGAEALVKAEAMYQSQMMGMNHNHPAHFSCQRFGCL